MLLSQVAPCGLGRLVHFPRLLQNQRAGFAASSFHLSLLRMASTFPFKVAAAKAGSDPAHQFVILAEVDALDDYLKVFEDYGYGGDGSSWREHIETIIEEYQPGLLDQLEFDEQEDAFLVYADSLPAVQQFMHWVLPYFGDLGKLKKYLSQADPSDFFE